MDLKFRNLRADEVDCRVATCTEKGVSILLYKDARCDMNILDDTVGAMHWQRHHSRDNANCTVSIFCPEMDVWVEKEDTGTESNTEAEKGLASDSFKRACFNWGIGRELYTAPFIWVGAENCSIYKNQRTGKPACNDKFVVSDMAVENGKIVQLEIKNKGNVVFTYGKPVTKRRAAAEPPKVPVSSPATQCVCSVCGKGLTPDFAAKSAAANDGTIYCSGKCKRAAENA